MTVRRLCHGPLTVPLDAIIQNDDSRANTVHTCAIIERTLPHVRFLRP